MTSDNDQQVSLCPGSQDGSREGTREPKRAVIEIRGDRKRCERADLMRTKQVSVEAWKNLSRWKSRGYAREKRLSPSQFSSLNAVRQPFQCLAAIPLCLVIPLSISFHHPRASRVLSSLLLPTTRPGVVLVLAFRGERPATKGYGKERLVFRWLLS